MRTAELEVNLYHYSGALSKSAWEEAVELLRRMAKELEPSQARCKNHGPRAP